MSKAHSHRTNVSSKSGPVRMATTQDAFRKELERRLRALAGALRETIVSNNALELPITQPGEREVTQQEMPEAAQDFDFETRTRLEAFSTWWNEQTDKTFLEPLDREDVGQGKHYSAAHIDRGYERGIKWADTRSREFGVDVPDVEVSSVIQRPVHQEAVETLYTRTYGELKTADARLENSMARILTDEVQAGRNSREIGDMMADELRTIRRSDARRIARSEVMNAHVQATGTRYNELGVEWAGIVTYDPCEKCEAFQAGAPYRISEVRAALPVHPNCVCGMVPAGGPDDKVPDGTLKSFPP